ncbi:MAG TPA: NAD(P)-binding protein [Bryobacteraceae bacterium]|nr:NAD(P)-binding protein [Bryobacteraceae bacterium]
MRSENIHTLILGAGPAGLAAGYVLAKAGIKPTVLEKDKVSGGLMRSIRHCDFIVDVGRKELYNRLAKVDEFWSDLLGADYRTYEHRGGILYDGQIIDMSRKYLGFRRGMPWQMFIAAGLDLLWWRMRPGLEPPRNLEEYWYQQRGRRLTQIANQGFQEKLVGRKWADVVLPEKAAYNGSESFLRTLQQAVARGLSSKETNTYKNIWRHPAKGTGQICESLECGILKCGGRVHHGVKVLDMAASEGVITSVTVEMAGETAVFRPTYVISSAPAEFLQQFLLSGHGSNVAGQKSSTARRRVVVLAYLFLDEEPRFPHFWLQVTCQKLRVGRIANYAALNSDMVPKGKTAICCEYYCFGEDPLLELDDRQMADFALDECSRAGLVKRGACFDTLVIKFPGADASQNRHNWFSKERQQLFAELRQFQNLYSVNRTDLDIATLAGIEAGEAILSGDRQQFDLHFSPDVLGIRSEGKPFEFRNPAGVEI